jgi:hypothetical protein
MNFPDTAVTRMRKADIEIRVERIEGRKSVWRRCNVIWNMGCRCLEEEEAHTL